MIYQLLLYQVQDAWNLFLKEFILHSSLENFILTSFPLSFPHPAVHQYGPALVLSVMSDGIW